MRAIAVPLFCGCRDGETTSLLTEVTFSQSWEGNVSNITTSLANRYPSIAGKLVFFYCGNGYRGIGRSGLRAGDQIVHLHDTHYLNAVRLVKGSQRGYTLVGNVSLGLTRRSGHKLSESLPELSEMTSTYEQYIIH